MKISMTVEEFWAGLKDYSMGGPGAAKVEWKGEWYIAVPVFEFPPDEAMRIEVELSDED